MIVYDNSFNTNEWSIIIGLCGGLVLVFGLPKRFPTRASLVFFMCGVYTGFLFDNSLSVKPFGLYHVNDSSLYLTMDFLLYLAYGPVSYLFFYVWDYMGLKSRVIPLYIFSWVLIVLGLEWLATLCGVFHYEHGYKIQNSIPIYLVVFLLWIMLYGYYQILVPKRKL